MVAGSSGNIDRIAGIRFVEELADVPSDAWLRAARAARETASERARALEAVSSLADEHRLGVVLWELADAVETCAWYALSGRHRALQTGPDAKLRAAALEAARSAAFAVAMRRHLTKTQFEVLYSPFRGACVAEGLRLLR